MNRLLRRRDRACSRFVLSALAVCACSDSRSRSSEPDPVTAPSAVQVADQADAAASAQPPARPTPLPDFPITGKEREALRSAGVVPAWDAVIDRWRYLARRGHEGAVFGRLGEKAGAHHWLIDETSGAGSLGIRAALPARADLEVGDSLVLRGAWRVDQERRWYWQAVRIERLPASVEAGTDEEPDPYAGQPGHVIKAIARRPKGAIRVSEVTQAGGDVTFGVVRRPPLYGDGWEISDRSDWRPVGILMLPGERKPYGGQDFMTDHERWRLDKGVQYTVRIRRWRPARKEGELPIMRAISAPMRIDRRAKRADR